VLEKSVFTNKKETINFIKEKYGINVTNIKIINRGSANIYSLNGDEYILKEFQSKYTKEEIEKEITIINHLKKDGIKVPSYIKTINDTYYSLYKDKVIIIQKFIEGYTLDRNEGNYEQTIECAKVYGMIVESLENLDILLPLNDLSFSKENLTKGIEKHQKLLELINDKDDEETLKIKRDLEEKINMIKNISKENILIDTKKLTIKNTHGDFNILQFIYKNNHINSVIDFVSACRMPVVWELIRSYSYIDKDVKNGIFNLDTFTDYIKEFNKYVKLNDYDLKYMSYIYLIQLLSSTYGYKEYINNNENIELLEFAHFRTNICKYLFNNAENISNRLLKIIKI
jgi:Ser/Thr protein kinase RdoA (MazF antagonist)